jgi:hypothetical protein
VALYDYWAESPPTHLVVAAAFLKRKERKKGDVVELLEMQNREMG